MKMFYVNVVIFSNLVLFAFSAYSQEPRLSNLTDGNRYVMMVGNIKSAKLVGVGGDPIFPDEIYDLRIEARQIRPLVQVSRRMQISVRTHTLDIESLKKKTVFLISEKQNVRNVLFWDTMINVLCMNENDMHSIGIDQVFDNKLNENCVAIG